MGRTSSTLVWWEDLPSTRSGLKRSSVKGTLNNVSCDGTAACTTCSHGPSGTRFACRDCRARDICREYHWLRKHTIKRMRSSSTTVLRFYRILVTTCPKVPCKNAMFVLGAPSPWNRHTLAMCYTCRRAYSRIVSPRAPLEERKIP